MEDHPISPWQIPELPTQTNLFKSAQKSTFKTQKLPTLNKKIIHIESNQESPLPCRSQSLRLEPIRKTKPSFSTICPFYSSPKSEKLSKLEIKPFSFPIQQILKQRQKRIRFSQKLAGNSSLSRQYQVIGAIFDPKIQLVRVYKQRSASKYLTANENLQMKNKNQHKSYANLTETINKLRNYIEDHQFMYVASSNQLQHLRDKELKLLIEEKQKANKFFYQNKEQSLSQFQKNHNLKLQNINLPEKINNSHQKILKPKQNATKKPEKLRKRKLTQIKLKIQNHHSEQKLQNTKCFRVTTNFSIQVNNKKKKILNQLQNYNLFGHKSIKRKTLRK